MPTCWYSPWRWSCSLLPITMTLIHCLYTAPPRHGDSLPHQGPQPNSSNPAQMWNPRLGSWHLATRDGKLSPAFFSHFQTLLGMPWNYSELSWAWAFSLDMTWKGMSQTWCSAHHRLLFIRPNIQLCPYIWPSPAWRSGHKSWASGQQGQK